MVMQVVDFALISSKLIRTTIISVGACLLILSSFHEVSAQTCVPPPAGLVSWWPGNGNANDIADGNNGTLVNGASFAPAMVGQGFNLDGVDDYVSVPDATNLDGMARLTVDAWVRFDALPSGKWQFIVAKGAAVGFGSNSYAIWLAGDNLKIQAAVESPTGLNTVMAPDVIVPGAFYHVALTYDGSNIKIYLNGALRQSGGLSGAVRDTTFPLLIGRRSGTGVDGRGDVLIGLIDEVEVYNRDLSETEIQAIFNAGSAGKVGSAGCPDTSVPTWPAGSALIASNVGLTSLTLTWTPAQDNVGVKAYEVFRDGTSVATVAGTVNTLNVTGLTCNTQYTFKVEACDAASNCSTDGPSLTTTLTAQQAIQQLVTAVNDLVTAGVLNAGQANGLIASIQAALNQLNTGNTTAAANELRAFINHVDAYVQARILSATQGQALSNQAQGIVGCL